VALLALGWGGNAPALRFSLDYVPPFQAAGIRFALGLLVILLAARFQGVPLVPARADWAAIAGLGILFMVQISLLNLGSARTGAARQALLINSYPLFVPVLAHLFLPGERLSVARVGGTALAFLGVLILLGERALQAGGGLGDILVAASALLLAGKAVLTSTLVRTLHPYVLLAWQMIVAIPCFFGLSALLDPPGKGVTAAVGASLLYQGVVVAGFCFVGWTTLLRHFSPTRLSVCFFLTPLFGTLLSFLLLGEPVTATLAGSGLLVLCGLMLVNR